jgi:hypothetical protein
LAVLTARRNRSMSDPSAALRRNSDFPLANTLSKRWLAGSDIIKVAVSRRSLAGPTRRRENEVRACTSLSARADFEFERCILDPVSVAVSIATGRDGEGYTTCTSIKLALMNGLT